MIPLGPGRDINIEQMERDYAWRISNGTTYKQTLYEYIIAEFERHWPPHVS